MSKHDPLTASRRAGPIRRRLGPAAALASAVGALSIGLAGCAVYGPIRNTEPVEAARSYQPQYRGEFQTPVFRVKPMPFEKARCANDDDPRRFPDTATALAPAVETLIPGDLLDVKVGQDEILSGAFKVSQDGTLRLPHLPPVRAQDRTVDAVEADIVQALLARKFYRSAPEVSVRVTDTAGARVFVSGAVFEPGAVVTGGVEGRDIDAAREKAGGWTAEGRRLSRALQQAGGVRPDADLAHLRLVRGDHTQVIDVRPALMGKPYSDVVLLAGDRIELPSRGCFQEALMTPSAITQAGVKVFMSNLTQPASSNASSAIGRDTTELRYGTRFMQAMVGMNCVGGANLTNADRSVVLFTHNPLTGQSIVISRRIEDLLRRADRDDYNPYILPGDALACYDSTQTNVLSIANAFGTVLSSALLASKL